MSTYRWLPRHCSTPTCTGSAFRTAYPVPGVGDLTDDQQRDRALVRLLRVCAGRGIHGIDALHAAEGASTGVPAGLDLPDGSETLVTGVIAWFIDWCARSSAPSQSGTPTPGGPAGSTTTSRSRPPPPAATGSSCAGTAVRSATSTGTPST
jgi:hypothetical protein